jgi:serine/threonine protein kinase
MANDEIVSGLQRSWTLLEKLGEGDAGEVYRVESLIDRQQAILKRPHRSAFTGDINRQAAQIAGEAEILQTLGGLDIHVDWPSPSQGFQVHVPLLLDRSKPGAEFSDRFFIIIELARGSSLSSLARLARFGQEIDQQAEEPLRLLYLQIAESSKIPDLVVLRTLAGILELFHAIHTHKSEQNSSPSSGLIWNDVKPDHLFWDPQLKRLTIIDWGNGKFLDPDGTSSDFRFTRVTDYSQYILAMGSLLADNAPSLYSALQWPEQPLPVYEILETLPAVKSRLEALISAELRLLASSRQQESNLLLTSYPQFSQLAELEQIHRQIFLCGEIPNYIGLQEYIRHLADRLVEEVKLEDLRRLCLHASNLPAADISTWQLLDTFRAIAQEIQTAAGSDNQIDAFMKAIHTGLQDDWPGALWIALAAAADGPEPAWWQDLACLIREFEYGIDTHTPTPLMAIKRALHSLQSVAKQIEDTKPSPAQPNLLSEPAASTISIAQLIEIMREEVIVDWARLDPDPPDSGIEYSKIDRLLIEIGEANPAALEVISRALEQPKAQVKLTMEAWGRKEFETARRGLRNILLWDPDRRRLFLADLAMQAAAVWLASLSKRPRRELTLLETITPLELEGRELRNQVGPSRWLDLILETLTSLRKGANPADLVYEKPELKTEIPWLSDLEPPRPVRSLSAEPARLERQSLPAAAERTARGIHEARIGTGQEVRLNDPLDTWVAEARGSSARVFTGSLRTPIQSQKSCAIKIMRPDRVEYALPLFREEIQVLAMLRDVQGVTPLLECGYIRLDNDQQLPADSRNITAEDLTGDVLRYAPEEIVGFLAELANRAHTGWLPYLAIDKFQQSDNLLQFCDIGHTHGRFLPLDILLSMAIQICDILEVAHGRNIVYRDHKILHYYWLEQYNGIFVIDWNVAKRHSQGLSSEEKQFDLVQLGARALHHIFTGRPAPGALPLGPTRPDEIEAAAHTYRPQWTYDDQRLPTALKDIIEKNLAGGYTQVRGLRYDLYQVFQQLSASGYTETG